MLERRRALGGSVPVARVIVHVPCRCRPPTPTRSRRARASSRSPRRWPSSACSRTSCETRSSGRGSCRSSPTRRAPSGWTRSSRRSRSTTPRAELHPGRPRAHARLPRVQAGQILHLGINEAARWPRSPPLARLRDPWAADGPDLHLLLDVRLPAHRRLDLGGWPTRWPRLPHRCHGGPHHADRRGPAARRRALAVCSPRPTPPSSPTTRPSATRSPTSCGRSRADVRRGRRARRRAGRNRDAIYYLTVYNEPIVQPAEPDNLDVEGRGQGACTCSRRPTPRGGSTSPPALNCSRRVWRSRGPWRRSGCSPTTSAWPPTSGRSPRGPSLRRDGLAADEQAFLHPEQPTRTAYVTQALRPRPGPVVAVSDYMRAVQDQIRPRRLGSPGFFHIDFVVRTLRPRRRRVRTFSDTRLMTGGSAVLPHRRPVDRGATALLRPRCRRWRLRHRGEVDPTTSPPMVARTARRCREVPPARLSPPARCCARSPACSPRAAPSWP
jgi:hypothetical protein